MSKDKRIEELEEALEGMVDQFAYRRVSRWGRGKRLAFNTGGLSALEWAFDALGWDDPHYIKDPHPKAIEDEWNAQQRITAEHAKAKWKRTALRMCS